MRPIFHIKKSKQAENTNDILQPLSLRPAYIITTKLPRVVSTELENLRMNTVVLSQLNFRIVELAC